MRKINKSKAIILKQLGWSYQQIAQEIGCSVAWCAKYLSGIESDIDMMKKAADLYHSKTLRDQIEDFCEDDYFAKR